MISLSCLSFQTVVNSKILKMQKLRAHYAEITHKKVIVPMDTNANSHMV